MDYEILKPTTEDVSFAELDREKLPSDSDQDFFLRTHDQLTKLSWFLHGALGHSRNVDLKRHLPITNVSSGILSRINADLNAEWFTAELEDEYGMDIPLLFADNENKVSCVLDMSWRID